MSHDPHAHSGHDHGPAAGHEAAPGGDEPFPPAPQTLTQRITRRLKKADRGLVPILCLAFVFWACGTIASYQGPVPYPGASRNLPSWRSEADNTTVDRPEGFPANSGPACACHDCRHSLEHNQNFRIFWLFNEQPFAEEYYFKDQTSFLHAWQETLRKGRNFHAGGRWAVDIRYGPGRAQSACEAHDCGMHLTAFHCDLYLIPRVAEPEKNSPLPEDGRAFRTSEGKVVVCDWEWRPSMPAQMPGGKAPATAKPAEISGVVMEPCRCSGGK